MEDMSIMVQVSQKCHVNLYGRYVHRGSGKPEVPCESYMEDMSIMVQVSQKCHVNLIWKICPSWFR
jgi:hypothetical protein